MYRTISLVFLTIIATLALFISPASAAKSFPETGFSITNDKFLDYFNHRGGVRVFGFPISREFLFLGTPVQFFQRAVLQLQPDGSVSLLNILDDGLLPYTQINGSSFPAPDPAIINAAPSPSDPNYPSKALDFVKSHAPDSWQGLNTNFYSTFISTVSLDDAFPSGNPNPDLLPLINLEIWGLPTSNPAFDPNNNNFVYLRFQRGIMHFDKTTGLTQGILIGDYLKSVITGQNLPQDLDKQASSSKLYKQYTNASASGLARPNDLPATTIFASFEKDGVVIPTPAPTATPAAAPVVASPTPTASPTGITIVGTDWFIEQTNRSLDILKAKANEHYMNVIRYVSRIERASIPSYDINTRTLYVDENSAFPPKWRFSTANQSQWYAGLIVHNATHIEQAVNGRPYTGYDAEREARLRQFDVITKVETAEPGRDGGQFYAYLKDVVENKEFSFGCWEQPRDPK